eukprot:2555005-Prymnesium_polylepis.2
MRRAVATWTKGTGSQRNCGGSVRARWFARLRNTNRLLGRCLDTLCYGHGKYCDCECRQELSADPYACARFVLMHVCVADHGSRSGSNSAELAKVHDEGLPPMEASRRQVSALTGSQRDWADNPISKLRRSDRARPILGPTPWSRRACYATPPRGLSEPLC